MPHRLHLCVLAAGEMSSVQVATHRQAWLWPVIELAGSARFPLALADRLISVVGRHHLCCITHAASTDGTYVDWLAVVIVDHASLLIRCTWTSLHALDERAAVLSYQADALVWLRAGLDQRRLRGAFEDGDTLSRVTQWIADVLGESRWRTASIRAYRLMAHEAVLAVTIPPNRCVYFKASAAKPFRDAVVTQLIAGVEPAAVPRTLAWDASRGWWLLDHVDGLADPPQWTAATARRVIATIRDLQCALRPHRAALAAAGATAITPNFIEHSARDLAAVAATAGRTIPDALARGFAAVHAQLRAQDDAVWHHGDLAPQNIAVTRTRVAFIDQESAMVATPLLSAPKLARTCQVATANNADWLQICCDVLSRDHTQRSNTSFLKTAATVVAFAVKTVHLRQRQAHGEYLQTLDPIILRAAEKAAAALRTTTGGS